MEDPHEHQQSELLSRIVTNISKLNQTMTQLNGKLESINKDNADTAHIANMWSAYNESVRIHIDTANKLSGK